MAGSTGDLMAALRFLRVVREDAAVRERVGRLDPAEGLGPVVAIAAAAGFAFSVESLRVAHAHDWALRRARYTLFADRPAATPDRAASTVAVVNSASSST